MRLDSCRDVWDFAQALHFPGKDSMTQMNPAISYHDTITRECVINLIRCIAEWLSGFNFDVPTRKTSAMHPRALASTSPSPQDLVSVPLTNLQRQGGQSRISSTVAITIVAETWCMTFRWPFLWFNNQVGRMYSISKKRVKWVSAP